MLLLLLQTNEIRLTTFNCPDPHHRMTDPKFTGKKWYWGDRQKLKELSVLREHKCCWWVHMYIVCAKTQLFLLCINSWSNAKSNGQSRPQNILHNYTTTESARIKSKSGQIQLCFFKKKTKQTSFVGNFGVFIKLCRPHFGSLSHLHTRTNTCWTNWHANNWHPIRI